MATLLTHGDLAIDGADDDDIDNCPICRHPCIPTHAIHPCDTCRGSTRSYHRRCFQRLMEYQKGEGKQPHCITCRQPHQTRVALRMFKRVAPRRPVSPAPTPLSDPTNLQWHIQAPDDWLQLDIDIDHLDGPARAPEGLANPPHDHPLHAAARAPFRPPLHQTTNPTAVAALLDNLLIDDIIPAAATVSPAPGLSVPPLLAPIPSAPYHPLPAATTAVPIPFGPRTPHHLRPAAAFHRMPPPTPHLVGVTSIPSAPLPNPNPHWPTSSAAPLPAGHSRAPPSLTAPKPIRAARGSHPAARLHNRSSSTSRPSRVAISHAGRLPAFRDFPSCTWCLSDGTVCDNCARLRKQALSAFGWCGEL